MKLTVAICMALAVLGAGCAASGELQKDENISAPETDATAIAMATTIDHYLRLPGSINFVDKRFCDITLGKKSTAVRVGDQGSGFLPLSLKLYAAFTGTLCPIRDQYIMFKIRVIPDQAEGENCGAIYEVVKSDVRGYPDFLEDDILWSVSGCELAEKFVPTVQ